MSQKHQFHRPRNVTPHIRLNSNPGNLLETSSDNGSIFTSQPRDRRQLIPQPPRLHTSSSSSSLYNLDGVDTSTELLLPPRHQSRGKRYRDDSPNTSPPSTGYQPYRRPESPGSATMSPISPSSGRRDPFADSATSSRCVTPSESLDGELNTQTVSEKFNIMPSSNLLIFPSDVEKDDWLHTPFPGGKEPRDCSICSSRGCVNIGGLIFITLGVLMLMLGYPVLTWIEHLINPVPAVDCSADPLCIKANLPLLQNVRTGLIDPKTPQEAYQRTAHDGSIQNLVFSDEFDTDGRSFYEDDDAYFQAVNLWYGVTQDLEWYDPDAITTANGTLEIEFASFPNHGLQYRSGMLQSWNQLCFKGGYIEASISLPGRGDTSGFWPGFWTMGNLGRPGYASTTDGLWPYSYWDQCDYGITPNQSQTDGISYLPGMRLPACTCSGAGNDHPSPGISRSAPELDALEATVAAFGPDKDGLGVVSQSAQFAPFDIWYQPNYDFVELYDSSITTMNGYKGGPFQQAFSGLTNLNNEWYDGEAYQIYGYEYSPGATGYTTWYVGQNPTWTLDARAMGPNGNIGQRVVPEEPMAIVANLGMSPTFAFINVTGLAPLFPAKMRFDYIRIYQDSTGYITCDPPGYPSTEYIAQHPKAYQNPQATNWAETGYSWPQNSLMDGCS